MSKVREVHNHRFIRGKNHGLINYIVSFFFIVIPYFSSIIETNPSGAWATIFIGIIIFIYTSMTKFVAGWLPKTFLPMKYSIALNAVFGSVSIIVGWWMFPESSVHNIHYFFGSVLIMTSLFSRTSDNVN